MRHIRSIISILYTYYGARAAQLSKKKERDVDSDTYSIAFLERL